MNTSTLRRYQTAMLTSIHANSLRFPLRLQFTPVFGALIAFIISLMPAIFGAPHASAWAATTLLIGFLYFAFVPVSASALIPLILGSCNIYFALSFSDRLDVLHYWMSIQTLLSGVWMLRTDRQLELSAAGLMLGLNAMASFFISQAALSVS